MAYKLKIDICDFPVSRNESDSMNRWDRNRHRKKWHQIIYYMTLRKLPSVPLEKCKLTFIRYYYRQLDDDGWVGAIKPVADGLVKANIIMDDRPSVVTEWKYEQVKTKKSDGKRMRVIVEEVE